MVSNPNLLIDKNVISTFDFTENLSQTEIQALERYNGSIFKFEDEEMKALSNRKYFDRNIRKI